jgi:hypothetical protein
MKRFYRLYLETSFWKRLGDPAPTDRRTISYRFLRQIQKRHHLFISDRVMREAAATPDPQERKHVLRRIWSAHPRTLTLTRKAERIALDLLQTGGWGEKLFADMLHLGYSIASDMDALVTWDEGDLAREKTRILVLHYCRREGLSVPLIGTPEEVGKWLGIMTLSWRK